MVDSIGKVSLKMAAFLGERSPGKANLIAGIGDGDGGLILSGHTDTVPFDEGRWLTDPFTVSEADNRLYGLGTADMKSFLALSVEAIRRIDSGKLRAPLILLATADEESSMSGAKALLRAGKPRARYAVIGEPTGLRPVRMHKGIFMEAIRLQRQAGHSSDPSLGNNAMEGMHQVMRAIINWRGQLRQKHINRAFAVPVPTINLGHIHGGDSPNRICAECELHIDLRPLPGMDIDALRAELKHRAGNAIKDSGLALSTRPLFDGVPAMQTPANAELVKTAEKLTGHAAESVAFATEAPYLQQLGNEVVILGPGSINQAHQPNEFLPLEQIDPMLDILERLIIRYCVSPVPRNQRGHDVPV